MDSLKALMDGEYDNYLPMTGINYDNAQTFLGSLGKMPKENQSKAVKNLLRKKGWPTGMGNSRYEMEQKFDQLPDDILNGLLNKRLQVADTRFYVIKEISGKSNIDVFQGTDQKNVGIGNLANQKLEKDNWLLVFAVMVRYALITGTLSSLTVDFGEIPAVIRNGEWELEAGNKKLVGLTDCSTFDTRGRTNIPTGFYKLDSTKLIEPQTEIKMPIKFTASADTGTWIRVNFIGTSVIPY